MSSFDAEVTAAFLAQHHWESAHDPFEPYQGVAALFNADLHRTHPDLAPRGHWQVRSPYQIRHLPLSTLMKEMDANNAPLESRPPQPCMDDMLERERDAERGKRLLVYMDGQDPEGPAPEHDEDKRLGNIKYIKEDAQKVRAERKNRNIGEVAIEMKEKLEHDD